MSTENKVPAIRFKGFIGEWEECSLSKFVSSLDAGVSVNSGDKSANESEFGILKTSCVTNGFFEPHENKVVFQPEEINRLKEPVLENTIIISRMNTPALVGANAYIGKSYPNYFLPDRLWAAKPSSVGNLQFIAYILGSDKGRAALSELATGTSGSMKNISKPAVFDLKFLAPNDEEQTKIGDFLQQLDTLIAQHQQKHAKLLNLKKALLEKCFPQQGQPQPAIRFKGFSGEWEEKSLADLCEETYGGGTPKTSVKEYWEGNIPWIQSSDLIDGEVANVIARKNISDIAIKKSATKLIPPNSIAIVTRVGVGKISLMTKEYTTSQDFLSMSRLNVAPLYGVYLIWNKLQKEKLAVQGTSIKGVTKEELLSKTIYVAQEKKEQTKIGQLFQQLDTLINQHQAQLNKLGNIKQACLAKLFV